MLSKTGLTSQEAAILAESVGYNEILTKTRQTSLHIFLSQFKSILILLLIVASIASLLLGDVLDGVFIFLIVILNGILGFAQEYKAEKAIAALKSMTISTVRVMRDGIETAIDSKLLVPGDIIFLEEGDKVPADCQLIDSMHLEVNEASLTGESLPVGKNHNSSEENQIFLGTIIVGGRTKALVTAIGMQTRFGKIALSLSEIQKEDTPLQKKLDSLGKLLGILAIAASSVVFIIGYLANNPLIVMILTSISLAVAAVPEGLPAVITITLAVGMQRMARKKAILRKLSSIEALGNTTLIATDKTGTLTRNQMKVSKIWLNQKIYNQEKSNPEKETKLFYSLLKAGVICNNANLITADGSYTVLGDTTEGSLLLLAHDNKYPFKEIKEQGEIFEEYSFDPTLKTMSVIWKEAKDKIIYSKGAPESIIDRCVSIETANGIIPLRKSLRLSIEEIYKDFAKEGLRILALAYRKTSVLPKNRNEVEKDLILIGFIGITDPPREEVAQAISIARSAGIRTIMITGDNELTAQAIGIKIGLIKNLGEVLTGKAFEKLSDIQATKILDTISIFARTTPDQKLRIVRLLQKKGHIVTVTGDGVNDALALKQADVGVAMGITGTDVAKESSDMIITDDNYASLIVAVEEGRTIFLNIKSAIKYLVGCNIGEVAAVVVAILLGWPLILTPLQLLYINLVTDGLPAIALAVSPKYEGIMQKKPRCEKGIFSKIDKIWLLEVSLLTTVTTLASFYIGMLLGGLVIARTLCFSTIILVQQFILLDLWAKDKSFIKRGLFKNSIFLLAFFGPILLQPVLIYTSFLSNLFKISSISYVLLLSIFGLSLVLLISSEVRKIILANLKLDTEY